ncbi:DUF2188 domain-containing protein [Bizionia gelidisalsuginis]|uniref:DUF2188 domain-containing protein n=1 Tax=Bizionia gelidisalsuginis TaxID=291188 RepID=A0ABY3MBR9_9FLAO|nr:DUF2188 domain-containing protein [Bizionia gelidisalsuginis]TYC14765.1 DUF2188 domain-containing protein [Bizionia gelidisalsuginis]
MKNFHLVHDDGMYKLKKENAQRASKVIDSTKADAIKQAAAFVKSKGGGSLRIHKNLGGFKEERTYPRSNDPKQSKG